MTTRLTTTSSAPVPVDPNDGDSLFARSTSDGALMVETKPISPSDAGSSLEKVSLDPCARSLKPAQLLAQRSDPQELKDKNILKAGGNLAQQREALERSMLEDKLAASLERRPPPDELVREGILNKEEAPPTGEDPAALQGDAPTLTPQT